MLVFSLVMAFIFPDGTFRVRDHSCHAEILSWYFSHFLSFSDCISSPKGEDMLKSEQALLRTFSKCVTHYDTFSLTAAKCRGLCEAGGALPRQLRLSPQQGSHLKRTPCTPSKLYDCEDGRSISLQTWLPLFAVLPEYRSCLCFFSGVVSLTLRKWGHRKIISHSDGHSIVNRQNKKADTQRHQKLAGALLSLQNDVLCIGFEIQRRDCLFIRLLADSTKKHRVRTAVFSYRYRRR